MSKKKPKKYSIKSESLAITQYIPLFSPDFKNDLHWWYSQESKKGDRIIDLIADILDGNPFTGIGKPEPLKYIGSDIWSRRIDLEHRLVYKVSDRRVYFLQARYHYQKEN
jgi:toxin YoeB